MKAILYVMTHRSGDVETFQINSVQQNESDSVNLELFGPEKLMGKAKEQLDGLVEDGYSLSNWHVIEPRGSQHITLT